jgi:hypothetical protein
MTTNIYDLKAALLTSDSRWSAKVGDLIAYVDNTNYDKIVFDKRLAFLFAGDLPEIDLWKSWIIAGRKKLETPPIMHAKMQVIQIDIASGKVVFQSHNFTSSAFGVALKALFAGTGAGFAKACWDVNKCAKTAIVSASVGDARSGGDVKFLKRDTKVTNVTNSATSADVQEQLKVRGFLMNTNNAQATILVKDAANDASHPGYAIAQSVMTGAIPLSAPFPGMDEPWSKAKKAEFEAALALYDDEHD